MATPICSPDGLHGVIVIHPFGAYGEAEFLDDPEIIESLVQSGEGWRIVDAVRVNPNRRTMQFSEE